MKGKTVVRREDERKKNLSRPKISEKSDGWVMIRMLVNIIN